MTTLSTIATRAISRLNGTRRMIMTVNSNTMATATTSMIVSPDRAALAPGSVVEFPDGEQVLIMSGESTPYTVVRGYNGTAAVDQASNQLLTIEPRWPVARVLEYAVEEIFSWPDDLGAIIRVDVTSGSSDDVTEIPDIANRRIGRLGYVYVKSGLGEDWTPIDATLVRSTDFASGWGLKTEHRITREMQVEVMVAPEKGTLTAATDLATLGYERSMEDILLLGIMQRCLAFAEAGRSDGAGYEAGRSEANPPTAMTQNAEYYATMRTRRIADEIYRVHSRMPLLRTAMS
jgi:hypothetical protein